MFPVILLPRGSQEIGFYTKCLLIESGEIFGVLSYCYKSIQCINYLHF